MNQEFKCKQIKASS